MYPDHQSVSVTCVVTLAIFMHRNLMKLMSVHIQTFYSCCGIVSSRQITTCFCVGVEKVGSGTLALRFL